MNGNLAYQLEAEEEIIGGKIVMMASPTLNHIFIAGNIYTIFNHYLRGGRCTPLPDGAALFLDNGEQYKPDMMLVCDPEKLRKKGVYGVPDLVVEVLSPGTARNDRGYKKDIYEKNGVREYWIVDPANRAVEQYILENGHFILRDVYTLYSSGELDDMTEEERAAAVMDFKCTLFDDFTIYLKDIFYRVMTD